jgi:hypothetical protein
MIASDRKDHDPDLTFGCNQWRGKPRNAPAMREPKAWRYATTGIKALV